MHRAGVRTIRLGTHQECVGSSQKVSGVCQDDAREFAKRRPRLARRLSWVAEKLTGKNPNPFCPHPVATIAIVVAPTQVTVLCSAGGCLTHGRLLLQQASLPSGGRRACKRRLYGSRPSTSWP
ncbi:hypothetical protein GW17_00030995 [Ensete ventricosum]|nr:hypothetical protein GW17_00030995 [Ensete ventricosum]